MVTRGWWQKFCAYHTELCHRTAVPLSIARAMATDQDVLNCYFEMLIETSDNGLLNRSTQIYNCDEIGLPLGATSLKVIVKMNSKSCSITSFDKKQDNVCYLQMLQELPAPIRDFQNENPEPRTCKW